MGADYIEQYEGEGAEHYMRTSEAFFAEEKDKATAIIMELMSGLAPKANVLDAGCGYGRLFSFIIKWKHRYHGFDASMQMVALASKNVPDRIIRCGTFSDIPFDTDSMDCVVARYSLMYAPDMGAAFREFHRVLKPGGRLIFVVAHPVAAFAAKKNGHYFEEAAVTYTLYNQTRSTISPSRTFGDYLNPQVLKLFELLDCRELETQEKSPKDFPGRATPPDGLALSFRAR